MLGCNFFEVNGLPICKSVKTIIFKRTYFDNKPTTAKAHVNGLKVRFQFLVICCTYEDFEISYFLMQQRFCKTGKPKVPLTSSTRQVLKQEKIKTKNHYSFSVINTLGEIFGIKR